MTQLKIKKLVLGPVRTNCYIVYDEESRQSLVIDPADRSETIINTIEEMRLAPVAILLTHGHFDHILAAEAVRNRYQIPVCIHEEEAALAADERQNEALGFGLHGSVRADRLLRDGEELEIGVFCCRVIHTPGHTKGGVCYYFEQEGILFSGDTLFAQSVGRTDLYSGNYSQLIHSVRDKLFLLPKEVHVFPGHDEETSIGYEMEHNPFVV